MEKAFLERCLRDGMSLPEIGRLTGKHPSTVGYWVQRHRLEPVGAKTFSPRGGLPRDDLEPLVQQGLTLAEIAAEVDRSISTVRHWLRKYGLETDPGRRRALRKRARAAGETRVLLECAHHGRSEFHIDGAGRFRCVHCRAAAVVRRRRKMKKILVSEAGGSCRICGYDRCTAALQFHHLDPSQKSFALSLRGLTRSIAELRKEAEKCVLLCSNCHAEVEVGASEVSPVVIAR